MQTARITSQLSVGGISFGSTIQREAEGNFGQIPPIPAGVAGAISATGVDGLTTGHGFTGGDLVDIHWTDSGDAKCRRGVTIDTASTNAITFDDDPAAEGDALPSEDTAVVVSDRVTIEKQTFDGDAVIVLATKCTRAAVVDFRTADASKKTELLIADEAWWYVKPANVDEDENNPFADAIIAKIVVSNATTSTATLSIGALIDSVE